MNIPSIPTDSLYKFIAIFGLVLTVSGIYFNLEYSTQLENQRDKYETSIDLINYEITKTNSNLKYFISQIEIKCKLSTCDCIVVKKSAYNIEIKTIKNDCDEAMELAREILDLQDKLSGVSDDADKMKVELDSMKRILVRKENESAMTFELLDLLIQIGFFLTLMGFLLWYFLVQRYQDRILKLQALIPEKNKNQETNVDIQDLGNQDKKK